MAERWARWAGVVAVVLWVVSVLVSASAGAPGEDASEAEYLAYVQEDTNTIIVGGSLFMLGCVAFLWFAVVLRERLAAAEGASRMLSNVAFVGAALVGAFMMLTPGPEIAAAIIAEEQEVSASAAAAMRMLPEAFLVAAAFSAILLMLGSGIVALRTRIFPKGWAWFSFLLALLLVIPPIGWAALLLGLPVWVIATTVFPAATRTARDGRRPARVAPRSGGCQRGTRPRAWHRDVSLLVPTSSSSIIRGAS